MVTNAAYKFRDFLKQHGLDPAFGIEAMAHDLDVKTAGKGAGEFRQRRFGGLALAFGQ